MLIVCCCCATVNFFQLDSLIGTFLVWGIFQSCLFPLDVSQVRSGFRIILTFVSIISSHTPLRGGFFLFSMPSSNRRRNRTDKRLCIHIHPNPFFSFSSNKAGMRTHALTWRRGGEGEARAETASDEKDLLPWEKEKEKERKKIIFLFGLHSSAGLFFFFFLHHHIFSTSLEEKTERRKLKERNLKLRKHEKMVWKWFKICIWLA